MIKITQQGVEFVNENLDRVKPLATQAITPKEVIQPRKLIPEGKFSDLEGDGPADPDRETTKRGR